MQVQIFDNWNRPPSKLEEGGGKRITESAGYIPVRVQVENMIIAGERLGEYRREKYDFGEGTEVDLEADPDPTRSPAFDMADATYLARETSARLKAQANAAKEKIDADKAALENRAPPKEGA